MMKTTAIIVGAGASTRMNMSVSKQLIKLNGKETIVHTLTAFEKAETIDEIIVVCRNEDKQIITDLAKKYHITKLKAVVQGGATRQQSVSNGVNAIINTDYVAIHDGARPLVHTEKINEVVRNAYRYGSSALGVGVKDTIKVVDNDGFIVSTPQRSTLMAIHTPQVFSFNEYQTALQKAIQENKTYTDDCQLMEAMGKEVYITLDEYTNLKLTTPEDILMAETFQGIHL